MKLKYGLLVLSLLVCLPLYAQKTTGTIRGTVTDQTGAVVSGAQVTVVNTANSDTRTATTSSEGTYALTDLQPGSYDLRVKHGSFKETVIKANDLHVASEKVVDVALQVGSQNEQVNVEANAVQVETTTGTVGNVVEGNQVRELPLNGRSFVQLTQLMPGVSPASNFDSKNKGLMAGVDFSVNGNNTTGNIFMVDGVNNNDIGSNRTILVYPSIDAIQEFKILRNSYGPEYGQAMGAVINIVTRGGTNQFHGNAFYFGRNDKLNASDYFNNLNGLPKDTLRRNDWGYTFGGPIIKDKLFFFWSQEWNRELRGKARSANVPTIAEKNGDFSALRTWGGAAPGTGQDCENNPGQAAIPAGETSPAGSLLVAMFPDPTKTGGQVLSDCNNWAVSLTAPIFWRQENIRMDYKISSTWSLMGRYTHDAWSQPFPSTLGFWGDDRYPSIESSWIQPGYQATVKLTKVLGSTAVNDFQLSYAGNRITAVRAGTDPGLNDQIDAALPTLFPVGQKFFGNGGTDPQYGYPIFWGGLGNGANSDNLWTQAPWHNNEELYILKDDFSKVISTHTFKVGFIATNNKKNELVNPSSGDASDFWGAATNNTNNGTFNALWNQVLWGFDESTTNIFTQTRWHDFETYFGDTWKARRNLSVEYGFRWSFLRQPFAATDKLASFQANLFDPSLGADPCNGMLVVPGTTFCQDAGFNPGIPGANRSLKAQNNHAISPRLGFAWDPKGDGKMSVRAGVGQFFQRERLSNYLYAANNSPFALAAHGSRPFDSVTGIPLTASGSPSFGLDPSSNLPNTLQWNLSVERELYRDTKLEVAYVANRGIHLLRYRDANFVPLDEQLNYSLLNDNHLRTAGAANFGAINYAEWTANSNYHSLQTLFRTRVKSLDAQFAYTWSKSLADTDITNSGGGSATATESNHADPHFDYGPTSINRPHVFVGNIVYHVPTMSGHGAIVKGALGGWELASILSYASGPSVTVFNGGTPTGAPGGWSGNGTGQGNDRPFRLAGQSCRASGADLKTQWLNTSGWTANNWNLGQFGTSPTGVCAGPGLANTDFSVYKNFNVTERVGIQFRLEFYNLFNKTQFRADSLANQLTTGGFACTATNQTGDPTHFAAVCPSGVTNQVAWSFGPDAAGTAYGNGNFGRLSNDRGPREIQYAVKFTF